MEMRARILSLAGVLSLMFGLMAGLVMGGQVLAQDATPEATPAAEEETTTEATPEASTENIVTLVAWYQRSADGETLELRPLVISPTYVASAGELGPENLTGTVDFAASKNKGGQPRITLGDSIFDAYPLEEGNYDTVQRWFFWDNVDGERPATLVLQVDTDRGPYEGAQGMAIFASRDTEGTGVLTLILYLPQ
jgi:hypothetical protein